ncbi:MAG TPA: PspA/IM30 family protein [Acidimicrobiales bacterium]|jgi:phage shock protein A|nr:PspA/IM30 family protein [Acidimicrobiales bacterium]
MGMLDVVRKRWAYFTAKTNSRFEENADPKIQLEQAISEAQDQHRRLVEQAAMVVANQKQHELQLNRAMEELEKVNRSTRQALMMAQEAEKAGDVAKSNEYNQTAEAFANRLIATENQVNDLKTLSLQSAQASDQARSAVQQNSLALQQKLAERQKLLSQLDQAKMQEQLNTAMSNLNQTVDQTAPSLDQVREKIEARYAKAIGTSEISGQTVEARMLEVQQAAMGSEAKSRLDTMRIELGMTSGAELSGPKSAGAIGSGTSAVDATATIAEDVAEVPNEK